MERHGLKRVLFLNPHHPQSELLSQSTRMPTMVKEEDPQPRSPDNQEQNTKAEANLRGLLASYSYSTPTPTPQSLPRRSPRNFSSSSPLNPSAFAVNAEAENVTLPLTPTSNVKARVARTGSSSSSKKRKHEPDDDNCLPLPLSPSTTSLSGKASKKQKRGYAPPETYAHLKGLPDHLAYELDGKLCRFI